MSTLARRLGWGLVLAGTLAWPQIAAPASPPFLGLPGLDSLLEKVRARSPVLKEGHARIAAERARLGSLGALADPDLSVGLSRGMEADVMIEGPPGDMEAGGLKAMVPARREWSFMVGQTLPWPGKRAARVALGETGVRRAEEELTAMRAQQEGELLEGVLDLLALRTQRGLIEAQIRVWDTAETLAKVAVESGRGSTSDVMAALQSKARLRQRLLALGAKEGDLVDRLIRLAGEPLPESALGFGQLMSLPLPKAPPADELAADLLARSPEFRLREVEVEGAARAVDVARREVRPDVRVSAGVMAERGMAPGWKAEVGLSLPVFSRRKQDQIVVQRRAEQAQATHGREALRQNIQQRARERARAWQLAQDTAALVARELLPAGDANIQTLLGRFEHGRADFSAVLVALNNQLNDQEAHLAAVVALHRLSLHQHRASLDPPPSLELGAAAMTSMAASPAPISMPSRRPQGGADAPAPSSMPMKM